MSKPEQAAADLAGRDGRTEPAGTEPRTCPAPAPAAEAGRDTWEGYDLAILNAVLDS
jgi:hypothetical protein